MADEKEKKREALKLVASAEHEGILYSLCHDSKDRRLYAGGADYAIHEAQLDPNPLKLLPKFTVHNNYVSTLSYADGGLISGSYDGRLVWSEAATGQEIASTDAHDGWIRDSALFSDGSRLATVGDDMRICLWNVRSAERLACFNGHTQQTPEGYHNALYAIAVSPDGRWLASGDRTGAACLWDVEREELVHKFRAPGFYTYDAQKRVRSIGGIRSLCFSADGKKLAIGGIGQVTNVDGFVGPSRVEVWDWQEPKRLFTGEGKHKAVLNHLAFHPTKPHLLVAAGGGDGGGLLAVWNQQDKAPVHTAKPKGHLQQFRLHKDGTQLYAAGYGGLQIWEFTEEFTGVAAKKG